MSTTAPTSSVFDSLPPFSAALLQLDPEGFEQA